jgi:flagellar hook assembly protein FlgD
VFPFDLSAESHVRISVYSATGQEIAVLMDEGRSAGRHLVRWNGRDSLGRPVGSGLYLVRMEADGFRATRKAMLLR